MSKSKTLIDKIDNYYESSNEVAEAAPKKKVSFAGGTKHIRLDCPPGYRVKDNTCVKMSAGEILAKRKSARLAARKTKGKRALIARKRAMTMKRRQAAGL